MIIGSWIMGSINSVHIPHSTFVSLIANQGHQSFLLWCPSHVDSGLHGHLDLWEYTQCLWVLSSSFYCLSLVLHVPMAVFSLLFITCTQQGRKKAYSTCSTHLAVVTFTICPLLTLISTQDPFVLQPRGQGSGCLLHHLDPNAQPSYL